MITRIFLLLLTAGLPFLSQAQTNSDSIKSDQTVYTWPGTMPEFPGGQEALQKFIASNLKYPADARAQGIQGTVYAQYTVNADGTISNIKIAPGKGLSPSCDQAVIDVLSKFPKWSPGKNPNGEPIATRMIQKVNFTITPETK